VNVAIIGSRDFPDLDLVADYVKYVLRKDATVVSGGARGVDRLAVDTAKELGMQWKEILPDYAKHGRYRAPLIRNEEIVSICPRVVAFWDAKSTGTAHALSKARENGCTITIYFPLV
jgi:hypothetical protein